ncbi:hypothetical protein BGZ51_007765, partial [Haplosporangium sp. Z 767]
MSISHQKPENTSDNLHRTRNETRDPNMLSYDKSDTNASPVRKSSLNPYNSESNVDFVDYGGTHHKTPLLVSSFGTEQEHMDNTPQSLLMQSNTKQHGSSGPSGRSGLSASSNHGHTADNSHFFGLSPTFFKRQLMGNSDADSQTRVNQSYRGSSTTMQPDSVPSNATDVHTAPLDVRTTSTSDSMNKEQIFPSLAGKDSRESTAANTHGTLSKSTSEKGNNWKKDLHEQTPRIDSEQEMNSESTHANAIPPTTFKTEFDSTHNHHRTHSLYDPPISIGQAPHHDRFNSPTDNLEDVTDSKGDRNNSTSSNKHRDQDSSPTADTAAGTGIIGGLGAAATAAKHFLASMAHYDPSATETQDHMPQETFSTSPSGTSTSGQDSESSTHVSSAPIEHAPDQDHNDAQTKTIHEPYYGPGEFRSVGTNTTSPATPSSSGISSPAQKKRTTWYGFEVPVKEKASRSPRPLSLGFGYKEHVASFKAAKRASSSMLSPTVSTAGISSSSSSGPVVDNMQPQYSNSGREPIAHPFSPSQDRPVHVVESYNTSNMPKGHYLTHSRSLNSKKPSTPKVMPQYIPPNMRRSHVPPPPTPSSMMKAPLSTAPNAAPATAGGAASAMSLPSAAVNAQPQYPSTTTAGKEHIARSFSFSPSQDRPVHVAESYNTSNMPKGHYLTYSRSLNSKKPSTPKVMPQYIPPNMRRPHAPPPPTPSSMMKAPLSTAPNAAPVTAGGVASATSLPSVTASAQPQNLSTTTAGKERIARSFSPSQDRPVHVVESYHTSNMPKGHYLTHPSSSKTKEPASHKVVPNFIPANMQRSHVPSAAPAAPVATTQAPTTSSTEIATQPAGDSTMHTLAGGAAVGAPVASAAHSIHHMDHNNDNASMSQSTVPAGNQSVHAVALNKQKDDPALYPKEQDSYPRENQDQHDNIQDSSPRLQSMTSSGSGSMAVPVAAVTTAMALGSAADASANHVTRPSTHQREHHSTAATLKKPEPNLSLYDEEEGTYPRGGEEEGLHENPPPAVHPTGAIEEIQLDVDKMHAHHDAHRSMTDRVMEVLHGLHIPTIWGGSDGKDKESKDKEDDNKEAADEAPATTPVGIGAGVGALAAGATAMNKSPVDHKTPSPVKTSSAEGSILPGPSSIDKPVANSKTPSTLMEPSSEVLTLPGTASLAGGAAGAADTPPMDRSGMDSMDPPTVKAPSTEMATLPIAPNMLDAGGEAAAPARMNRTMIDSQAPLPVESSSTKMSVLPIASKTLGAGAGAASIAAALRARTPEPGETHDEYADTPVMDEDRLTSISARKIEPVSVNLPVDSVLVTDKATMTRSAESTIPYTSATVPPSTYATETPGIRATAFSAMDGKHDASAGTGTKSMGTSETPSYGASTTFSSTIAPLAAATAAIAAGIAHVSTRRIDRDRKELDMQDYKTTEHSAPTTATAPTAAGDVVKPTGTHINRAAETAAAVIPTAAYAAYVHKPHDKAEYDTDMDASDIDGPTAHKRDDHGHIVLEDYDQNKIDPTTTTHTAVPIVADETASSVDDHGHDVLDYEAPTVATTSTAADPATAAAAAVPVAAFTTHVHKGKEKAEYDSDDQKEATAVQTDHVFADKAPDTVATSSPHKTDEDIAKMRAKPATSITPEDENEMFPESVGSTSKAPPIAFMIDTTEESSWGSGKDVQMDPLTTTTVVKAVGSDGDEEMVVVEEIMETKENEKETDKETEMETDKKGKKPHVPIKARISNVITPTAAAITASAVEYKARQPVMKKRPSLRLKEDDVYKPVVPIVSHQLTLTEDDVDMLVVPVVSHVLTLTEDDVDKPVPRLSAPPVLRLTEDDVHKPDPSTARYPVIPKAEPKMVSTLTLKVANAPRPMIPAQPIQGKDIKLPAMHMPKTPKVHMPEMHMPKVSKPKVPKISKAKLPKVSKPKLPKVHMPTITKRKSKVAPEPEHVSSVTPTTRTTAEAPVVETPVAVTPAAPKVDAVAPANAPLPIFVEGDKAEIADAGMVERVPTVAPVVSETTEPAIAPSPVVQESAKPRIVEGPVKKPVIMPAAAVPVAATAAMTRPETPPDLSALPPSPPPVAQAPIPVPVPSPLASSPSL